MKVAGTIPSPGDAASSAVPVGAAAVQKTSQQMAQVLIAGAGNTLLACDRVGPVVLESIADRYGDDVELCDIGCTALALLDQLRAQDLLVVIDACIGRGEPGEVFVVAADPEELISPGTSAHQVGPLEALVVARHLYPELMPRQVVLVLVETGAFNDVVETAAVERVIHQLDREIDNWRRRRLRVCRPSVSIGGEA